MSLFKSIKRAVKKTVRQALSGVTDKPDKPKPQAQMGPAGDTATRVAQRPGPKRRRGARGRDSTIITARSEIGSRTLLG